MGVGIKDSVSRRERKRGVRLRGPSISRSPVYRSALSFDKRYLLSQTPLFGMLEKKKISVVNSRLSRHLPFPLLSFP